MGQRGPGEERWAAGNGVLLSLVISREPSDGRHWVLNRLWTIRTLDVWRFCPAPCQTPSQLVFSGSRGPSKFRCSCWVHSGSLRRGCSHAKLQRGDSRRSGRPATVAASVLREDGVLSGSAETDSLRQIRIGAPPPPGGASRRDAAQVRTPASKLLVCVTDLDSLLDCFLS